MEESYNLKVIGHMRSPFLYKNGTPRQSGICQQVTGQITIDKKIFNNPEHSLEGLENFSHLWIFFIFHKNNNVHFKAKVKPPRLNGARTGVFSTRSPYRPNNIGLTLGKIESVKGATVTVSGIDILDGTPIIDMKPFIPQYDNPESCTWDQMHEEINTENQSVEEVEIENNSLEEADIETQSIEVTEIENQSQCLSESTCDTCRPSKSSHNYDPLNKSEIQELGKCESEGKGANSSSCELFAERSIVDVNCDGSKHTSSFIQSEDTGISELGTKVKATSSMADWITNSPVSRLTVRFTPSAEQQLSLFNTESGDVDFKLKFLKGYKQAKEAIVNILHEDPRSTYRRNHCVDALYYFTLDVMHITCWFDEGLAEILRVKPINKVDELKTES